MSYLKIAGPWLDAGAKLEGGMGGDTPPPPKVRIIWFGRANHLGFGGAIKDFK
jgi:hypothetical protein